MCRRALSNGRFRAHVKQAGGHAVHLGCFVTAEAAALAIARDSREHGVEAREVMAPRAAGQDLAAEEAVAQAAAQRVVRCAACLRRHAPVGGAT